MKCTTNYSIGFALLLSSAQIQLGQPIPAQVGVAAEESPAGSAAYQIVSRGPNERVWSRVTWGTNAFGKAVARTNCFTELETSMHHWRNGQWLESEAKIELLADGAAATNGPCQVYFAANLNSPSALIVTAPDGRIFRSRVYGIAFYDSSSGKAVLIGETKDSIGLLVGDNEVRYTNAFEGNGIEGEVQYFYNKAGIEQNIVIRSQIPPPSEFGMAPASTLLQVISEFYDPPLPTKTTRMLDGNLADETLDFGAMKMGSGRGFSIGAAGETGASVPVTKEWGVVERGVAAGRAFLVEQVPFTLVEKQMQFLERKKQGASLIPIRESQGATMLAALQNLPPKPTAKAVAGKMQMAKLELSSQRAFSAINHQPSTISPQRAFILDYTLLTTQTNPVTLQADRTYYVSGVVNLSGSNTVFESGVVIKFSPTNTAKLNITGPITWLGSAYRPIIMTARDDPTVGESITTTNALTGYYADTALYYDAAAAASAASWQHLRIAYAKQAVYIAGLSSNVISHAQFVNCQCAVSGSGSTISLRNALMYNVLTNFSGSTIKAEHLTIDTADWLNPGVTLSLTNSLLVNVTNIGTFTSNTVRTGTSSEFQTVGSGSHYLSVNSTNRDVGTTIINPDLARDLKTMTTYPPVVYSAQAITTNLVLSPNVQRDTDTPDIGYHFVPLDYAFGGVRVTNATVTILPGTAVGVFSVGYGYGLGLLSGATLASEGTPTMPIWITRYHMVQEQANLSWTNAYWDYSVVGNWLGGPTPPEVHCRFTKWSAAADANFQFSDYTQAMPVWFADCEFHGGRFRLQISSGSVTNSLFERVFSALDDAEYGPTDLTVRNCLFYGGRLWLNHCDSGAWTITDTLFDQAAIVVQDCDFATDYNGYTSSSNHISPGGSHDITASLTFKSGPLGRYYQPTNSSFINAGSVTNAGLVGLYHYTVTTNLVSGLQIKEGNSRVDIGYHYVAVDAGGQPIDTDGDGLADYFEDTSGNGIYDAGDYANWNAPDTDGDGVSDFQEYLDGTNPRDADSLKGLLGRWHFDTTNWIGHVGQLPLVQTNLQLVAGVRSNAVAITNIESELRYKLVESSGHTNLNLWYGTVRVWFKPNWSSEIQPAPHPGDNGLTVFTVGPGTPSQGRWSMSFNVLGSRLRFDSSGPDAGLTSTYATVSLIANRWYQIALICSSSNSTIFINGKTVATGGGISGVPSSDYFTIGNNVYQDLANGAFDELETYDHPLSAAEIDTGFGRVVDDGAWPFDYYTGHFPPVFTITAPSEGSIF